MVIARVDVFQGTTNLLNMERVNERVYLGSALDVDGECAKTFKRKIQMAGLAMTAAAFQKQ